MVMSRLGRRWAGGSVMGIRPTFTRVRWKRLRNPRVWLVGVGFTCTLDFMDLLCWGIETSRPISGTTWECTFAFVLLPDGSGVVGVAWACHVWWRMVGVVSSFRVVQYADASVSPGCTASTGQSVTACVCIGRGSVLSEALTKTFIHEYASDG